MCLFADNVKTKKMLNRHKKNNKNEIIAWKILKKHNDQYFSPYQGMEYKIGKNIPNNNRNKLNDDDLYHGLIRQNALHVCTLKQKVYRHIPSIVNIDRIKIIKVIIKVKDIISYGMQNDIAVRCLYIDKFD